MVEIASNVDGVASETLRAHLVAILDQGWRWLVIDLSEVTYMDPVALTALASAHEYANARDGWVRLAGPNRSVRQALGVTGMDELLPVFGSVHAATDARHSPSAEGEPPEPVA